MALPSRNQQNTFRFMKHRRGFIKYYQSVKPCDTSAPIYPYLSSAWRRWAHSWLVGIFLSLSVCPALAAISLAPIVGAVNRFQTTTLAKWGEQISHLKKQLDILRDHKRNLESQLKTQREQVKRFKEYMKFFGNPKKAFGKNLSWKTIDIDEVLRNAKGLTEVLRDPLKGIREATESIPGIYEIIPQRTTYGTEVSYTPEIQARYSVVDADVEKAKSITETQRLTKEALYRELQHCMEALKEAGTDAEVQKLQANISAINGQLTILESYRAEANDRLHMQALHAHNQSEKEQAANAERSLQETQDESNRFEQLSRSIKLRRER